MNVFFFFHLFFNVFKFLLCGACIDIFGICGNCWIIGNVVDCWCGILDPWFGCHPIFCESTGLFANDSFGADGYTSEYDGGALGTFSYCVSTKYFHY